MCSTFTPFSRHFQVIMWHDTSVLCGRLAKPERLTSMNLICSWLLTYADRRWHRQPPSAISRGTCSQAWLLSLTPLSRLASSLRPARGLTQGWAMLAGCEVLLKWRYEDHTRCLATSNRNHQKYNWKCSPFDSVLWIIPQSLPLKKNSIALQL